MAFEKTLLFVAISVTLSSCWIHSAGANPVPTEDENQLDQDDSFKAGKPLTEEEFNSGATGNKGASMNNRPWENQEGGDVPPSNGNKKNGDVKWPGRQIPYVISSTFTAQERKVIASAMADFHKKTCIRFAPRKTQSDYLKIIRSKESQTGSAGYPG
ncbi:zinc metalloproteinase nas-8-like [Daphnia pulicaria]|uniref:zinc metalloproteinase nas-8-like n=1 Tax=Daphnia pulicaria TaxID=35523 RepID=UPI001EEA3F44|nr:zinc metalloproteinase nas-8-like [Daphnia pulicaria]